VDAEAASSADCSATSKRAARAGAGFPARPPPAPGALRYSIEIFTCSSGFQTSIRVNVP
jgi:hypothetical protein